jgi:hypothetical protein
MKGSNFDKHFADLTIDKIIELDKLCEAGQNNYSRSRKDNKNPGGQ